MVKRIDALTPAQEARFPEWVEKWTAIGLRTGDTDWETFDRAVRECYRFAKLKEPKVVVQVSSPLVMASAAPIAGWLLDNRPWEQKRVRTRKKADAVHGSVDGAVRGAVGGAVDGAVRVAVDGAVHGSVGDAVCVAVDGAVGGAVRVAVDDAVGDAVCVAVDGAVGGAVRGAVDDAVDGAVRGAVDDAVDGAVGDAVCGVVDGAVGGAVRGAVDDAVGDAVRVAVDGAVGDAVRVAVDGAVRVAVGDAVDQYVRDNYYRWIGGQFWVGGWYWGSPAWVSFFREVCGLELPGDAYARAKAYEDTCRSVSWWWPHREFVMVCARPAAIHRDARGRLHHEHGPAIVWPDGWGVYAIHGVRVPKDIVEDRGSITVTRIQAERNAEVRRVMVQLYGQERYLRDAEATKLGTDDWGTLWSVSRGPDDTPMVFVEVLNSTPEDDGSFKTYFLRVDPKVKTAREAIAWTFALRAEQYAPVVMS